RPERPAGDHRPRLMHPLEGRVVTTLADPGSRSPVWILREPPNDFDVASGVTPEQFLVAGRLGRKPRLGSDGPQQINSGPEPPRRQWMGRTEVVRGGPRSIHEQHQMARYRPWNGSTPRR